MDHLLRWLRPGSKGRRELQVVAIAMLASIAVGSVLLLGLGAAPGRVWWAMVERVGGSEYWVGQVLYKATGLVLCGLAVSIALDAGLFNIGAEGQMTAGILACAVAGHALPSGTPAIVAVSVCLLAAAAAGAAIGALIGGLRATRGAHEVVTSIMMNAIVGGIALWIGNELLFQAGTTRGPSIVASAELPRLPLAGTSGNTSIIIAVAAAVGIWWLRARTTWGTTWRAVGSDHTAARTAGISVGRVHTLVMTGAGALAGLAAANFVMGHKYAFEEGLGRGTGLLGISAAILGRSHPVGVVIASLVLGFLSTGGLVVSDMVPKEFTEVLQGIVVLAVAAAGPWVQSRSTVTRPAIEGEPA